MTTKIKYKICARHPDSEILCVEILRETDKFIFIKANPSYCEKGERSVKKEGYDEYHDTWESAHNALMKYSGIKLESAIKDLDRAKSIHDRIKGMKNDGAR